MRGGVLFGIIFTVVVGETWPHLWEDRWSRFVKVPSLGFWVVYLIAVPVGWKWEGIGGAVCLLAVLGWMAMNAARAGHWGIYGYFWVVLLVPGGLGLVAWGVERWREVQHSK